MFIRSSRPVVIFAALFLSPIATSADDCNGNNVPDEVDIAAGTSADCNANGVPDECEVGPRIIDDAVFAHDFEVIEGNAISSMVGPDAFKMPSINAEAVGPLRAGSQHVQAPNGTTFGNIDTQVRLTAAASALSFSIFYNDRGYTAPERARLLSSYDGAGAPTPGEFVFDILEDSSTTRRLRLIQNAGSGVVAAVSDTIPGVDGSWHHAGFVFEGGASNGTITFYFDGQILGAPVATSYNQTPAQNLNWYLIEDGNDTGNREYFPNGVYDEAALWLRAITPQEVNALYSGGISTNFSATEDCNDNDVPDECDVADGTSADCNFDGVPDECQGDCNSNGRPDDCDVGDGTSMDCNTNRVPDECDIAAGTSGDCNGNGIPDECDVGSGASMDCNANGKPDECDLPRVWTGSDFVFVKPDFADWNLPENQDRITEGVWITRANAGPLFNIRLENGWNGYDSPLDTEWAFGSAADAPQLTFQPFVDWTDYCPPCVLGIPAVLHLISEDVYIDIQFTSWSCCGDGGFAYLRGTPPPADCNSNGLLDECDITNGTSTDLNGNGIPDDCEGCSSATVGDLDADGMIDINDAPLFVAVLLDPTNATTDDYCAADMNVDDTVDARDVQGFVNLLLGS